MKRYALLAAGWLMVALGIVGVFLPLMPTTVFLIAAAWFFARSSPRFEAWLLDHPLLGPSVRSWRANGAIGVKAKALATFSMAGGYGLFWFAVSPSLALASIVAIVLVLCAGFILTRPSL